jgi:NAD(P)-dependent dehydrogenase (short-subunit alcohol dehydrogenase family)
MSLVSLLKKNGPSGFGYGSTAEQVTEGLDLHGKTILLTGCNSGLGLEAMRVLSMRGAKVVAAARTVDKAMQACATVTGPTIPLACELSDPASVRACVAAVKEKGLTLDVLLCNAGIMALPKLEQAHGVELQLFTNHVGHFMLVTGLLDRLAPDGRVVVLSSGAHKMAPKGGIDFDDLSGAKRYSAWTNYGQSKFANLLFAKELARRLAGSRRTANALHPGVIRTNLGRHMPGPMNAVFAAIGVVFFKDVHQGAATEVWASSHPSLAGVTGQYLADCNVAAPRPDAEDPALAKRLWDVTEEIVARLPR